MAHPQKYILGDYKAICDICGFEYRASELVLDFRGRRVCPKDLDKRNPQEFVRTVPDEIQVPWTRNSDPDGTVIEYTTNKVLAAALSEVQYFDTTASDLLCYLPAANEVVRTNYMLRNAEQDNGVWGMSAVTVSTNTAQAPDGNTTEDLVIPTVANSSHFIAQASQAIPIAGSTITASVFAAPVGYDYILLTMFDGGANGFQGYFNVTTGQVVSSTALGTGTLVGASIRPAGTGRYEVIVTGTVPGTTTPTMLVFVFNNSTSANFSGNGTSGIRLWGEQLEVGTRASGPLVTAGSTVARSASAVFISGIQNAYVIANTGTNNVLVGSPSEIQGSTIILPNQTGTFINDFTNALWRRR